MCLSFHLKKNIPIGKGGMVLTDSKEAYDWMDLAVYEGRDRRQNHDNIDDLKTLGWNMYMTPEQAARGLMLMQNYPDHMEDLPEEPFYRDLREFDLFKDVEVIE